MPGWSWRNKSKPEDSGNLARASVACTVDCDRFQFFGKLALLRSRVKFSDCWKVHGGRRRSIEPVEACCVFGSAAALFLQKFEYGIADLSV